MLKQRNRRKALPSRKMYRQLLLYSFPVVPGLEDISLKLNSLPAENEFCSLLHAFELKPITSNKRALEAERLLEYIERAFDKSMTSQIRHYHHILCMLLKEYDDLHHVRSANEIPPHEFLKVLLVEDQLPQKSLVPDFFSTESQVSEFLHQKKGRSKLSYEQAVLLGEKFKVDPLNFLRT